MFESASPPDVRRGFAPPYCCPKRLRAAQPRNEPRLTSGGKATGYTRSFVSARARLRSLRLRGKAHWRGSTQRRGERRDYAEMKVLGRSNPKAHGS